MTTTVTILNLITNITSPLTLAGLLAAAFFLIARLIISHVIKKLLNERARVGLLKHVIRLLFILAILAMTLGFAGFIFSKIIESTTRPAVGIIGKLPPARDSMLGSDFSLYSAKRVFSCERCVVASAD